MANILSPIVVSVVKGTTKPVVTSLSYGGGTLPLINSAFNQANTAITLAQEAYNYANTISGGSAIDNVARVAASTADTKAQNAWNKANTATTIAYNSYNEANAANSLATTADALAQAAFNKANSAGSQAAGTNYEVQYNRGGNFSANSNFIYDYSQSILHVTTIDATIDAGSF